MAFTTQDIHKVVLYASDGITPLVTSDGIKTTVADGANVALGAKADAAVTNPGLSASEIALLKGLLTRLNGGLPAALGQGNMAQSLAVVLASNQSAVPIDSELVAAALLADGMAVPTTSIVGNVPLMYNGTTLDIKRSNTEFTLLASAVRATTTATADQTNHSALGVTLWFNITAVPGVDTVQMLVETKDPIGGLYTNLISATALSATGLVGYQVFPAIPSGYAARSAVALSRTWRARIVHSAATNFTYSVAACYHG